MQLLARSPHMRSGKPWYRSDRDAWYVQHQRKQVLLARGKANKPAAMAAFHKLMVTGSGPSSSSEDTKQIAVLCDLFLDYSEIHHSSSAFKNYKHFLQAFCSAHGRMKVTELKPFHFNRWLDGKKSWN